MTKTAIETMVEWRNIYGTNGQYKISNHGQVKRVDKGNNGIIKMHKARGYYFCQGSIGGNKIIFRPHRIVAQTFIPNPHDKPQVNHKNGDKLDNRVGNLEWSTARENSTHAFSTNLNKSVGEGHPMHKLKTEQVKDIRGMWASGAYYQQDLADIFEVAHSTISKIVGRKTWKRI